MSFSQALSGLRAQSENIQVISNNIANSQTVGFKGSRIAFADVYAGAGCCGGSSVGLGVGVADILQDFSGGDLENTGRALDLAIAGQGFFRLQSLTHHFKGHHFPGSLCILILSQHLSRGCYLTVFSQGAASCGKNP